MLFCKGQDNVTQCCLFLKTGSQQQKLLQQQLQQQQKLNENPNNLTIFQGLPNKNHRIQKSQEKSKFSLSKLNTKKSNQQKEIISNISGSCASAPKLKVPQNYTINIPTLQKPITTQPSYNYFQVRSQRELSYPKKYSQTAPTTTKIKIYTQENMIFGTTPHQLQLFRANQPQKIPLGQKNQIQHYFPATINQKKLLSHNPSQSKQRLYQKNLNKSLKISKTSHHRNLSSHNKNNLQASPQLIISLQASQITLENQNNYATQPSLLQNHPNLKTSQSRYIHHEHHQSPHKLMNNISKHSFNSRNPQNNGQHQIIQSIVLMNFFNPNQKLKKQMQHNIQTRNLQYFK